MSDPSGPARVSAVAQAFTERYGATPRVFSAPGRVNLIGEHTDYNDGWVLPIAIKERTRVAAAARPDRVIRAYSQSLKKERSFSLDDPAERRGKWLDYVEGVARTLIARGIPVGGADLMIASEVPPGAGLSSSAALELAVGQALLSLASQSLPARELALVGQAAEHDYVGVRCGIMDQLVGALGRAGHALLIDCRSLEVTQVLIPDFSAKIVVFDTHVRHGRPRRCGWRCSRSAGRNRRYRWLEWHGRSGRRDGLRRRSGELQRRVRDDRDGRDELRHLRHDLYGRFAVRRGVLSGDVRYGSGGLRRCLQDDRERRSQLRRLRHRLSGGPGLCRGRVRGELRCAPAV